MHLEPLKLLPPLLQDVKVAIGITDKCCSLILKHFSTVATSSPWTFRTHCRRRRQRSVVFRWEVVKHNRGAARACRLIEIRFQHWRITVQQRNHLLPMVFEKVSQLDNLLVDLLGQDHGGPPGRRLRRDLELHVRRHHQRRVVRGGLCWIIFLWSRRSNLQFQVFDFIVDFLAVDLFALLQPDVTLIRAQVGLGVEVRHRLLRGHHDVPGLAVVFDLIILDEQLLLDVGQVSVQTGSMMTMIVRWKIRWPSDAPLRPWTSAVEISRTDLFKTAPLRTIWFVVYNRGRACGVAPVPTRFLNSLHVVRDLPLGNLF